MKNNFNKAFTLVELIVVITILSVLATVAFISFQGYTSSSRDSVRLADLKNISKSFEINRTKGIDFPLPDKKVDISSSGTIFQYQGELSQDILNSHLNIFDGGVDPLSGENYGYAVNSARNKFQIIGFLENQDSVANISLNKTFADNSDKYVKSSGSNLGILLDSDTNEVIIQSGSLVEIDIQNNSEDFSVVQDKQIQIVVSNELLSTLKHRINPIESCNNILLNGESRGNGIYFINPTGISGEEFEVYCDMKNYDGGWTLLLANREDTTRHWYPSDVNHTTNTLPNYYNWDFKALNSIDDFARGNKNIVSKAIENLKFQDIRFECLGENCLGSGVGIYSHSENSTLENKTGVFTLKGDKAWPFDKYPIYLTSGDTSFENIVPYDQLTINTGCVGPTSTRNYEACVQIGLKGVDKYNFQNSIGLGIYGEETYDTDTLFIQSPFGYIRHRRIENFNANIWIK